MQIDLKSIWAQQPVVMAPEVRELIKKAGDVKRKIFRRLLLINGCLSGTVVFVAYVGLAYKFQMATTRVGVVLTLLAIGFYIFVSNGMLIGPLRSDLKADSAAYLKNLLIIRKKQERLQGLLLNIYYILLTIGLGLYMIEFLLRMRFIAALLASLATFGWIVFNWFYLRPRAVKKQQAPLLGVIARLQSVSEQLVDGTAGQ